MPSTAETDVEIMVEIVKYIRRLPQFEPLKSIISTSTIDYITGDEFRSRCLNYIAKEVTPGPECIVDSDVEEYVRQNSVTTYREPSINHYKSDSIDALN